MKSLALALPALFVASLALGQEIPASAARDLWCGIAFGLVVETAPTDVNEDQQAIIKAYADGGAGLIERARSAYRDSGFSDAAFETQLAQLTATVTREVNATDNSARHSFEECSALLSF